MSNNLLYVSKNVLNFGQVWSKEKIGDDYIVIETPDSIKYALDMAEERSPDNDPLPSGYLVMIGHSRDPNARMDELNYEVIGIYDVKYMANDVIDAFHDRETPGDNKFNRSMSPFTAAQQDAILKAKVVKVICKLVFVDDEMNTVIS